MLIGMEGVATRRPPPEFGWTEGRAISAQRIDEVIHPCRETVVKRRSVILRGTVEPSAVMASGLN